MQGAHDCQKKNERVREKLFVKTTANFQQHVSEMKTIQIMESSSDT